MPRRKAVPDCDLASLELTRPQLARLFAVTESTISAWAREGMPQADRGRFLLGPCFTWWESRLRQRGDDRDGSLNATRIKLFDSQRRHAELAMEQRRTELLHADETAGVLTDLFAIIDKHLMALPARAAAAITGKSDPSQRARLILVEARQTRRRMAEDVERFAIQLADADT